MLTLRNLVDHAFFWHCSIQWITRFSDTAQSSGSRVFLTLLNSVDHAFCWHFSI